MRARYLALCLALACQCQGLSPAAPQGQVRGHGARPGSAHVKPGREPIRRRETQEEIHRLRSVLEGLRDERVPSGVLGVPGSWDDLMTWTRRSFLNLAPLYLPDPAGANPECRRDLLALYQAMAQLPQLVQDGLIWPLKLVDSWGKSADGVLVGNVRQLGFFSECLNIEVRPDPSRLHHLPDPELHLPDGLHDVPDLPDHLHGLPDRLYGLPKHLHGLPGYLHAIPGHLDSFPDLDGPPGYLDGLPGHLDGFPDHPEHQSPVEILRRIPIFQGSVPGLEWELSDLERHSSRLQRHSSPLEANFQGQYCLLNYGRRGNSTEQIYPEDQVRVPIASALLSYQLALMVYGTCIPSTCTHLELKETVDEALAPHGLQVGTVQCHTRQEGHVLGGPEICGIVLLSMLGVVLLSATLLDLWCQAALSDGRLRYLLVFSVSRNLKKIFHLETRKSSQVISCLHGIRFLSISWVVLGHQYAYSANVAQNPVEAAQLTKPAAFQMIANGDLSVDTFFFMSGLLVCLGVLGQVKNTRRFNVSLYYIHRLVRLLPPIAMTVLAVATVSGLVVEGPMSQPYTTYYLKGCRHSWWMDVTFTSNLFFPYLLQMGKTNEGSTCLPHCWYTGVDMQLYLVMPLILLPLCFWPKKGTVLLGLWTVASLVVPAVIIGVYHTWPASLLLLDQEAILEYNHKVYLMPWCRAGPYLVGAWAGYIIHKGREAPSLARLKTWQVVSGWVVAVGVALAVVFGLARYNYAHLPPLEPPMSGAEAVLYGGLHRAAWAAAVAWVVVACYWGYGATWLLGFASVAPSIMWPVDWFLSHPLWQPLSRLTYSIYLTSLPIQFMLLYSIHRPTYYSHVTKVQETCGVLLMVFLASVVLSLSSESPVLGLEKLLLQPSRKPGKAKESQEASEDIGQQRNIREVKIDLEDAKDDLQDSMDDLQAGKGDLAPTCKGLDPTVD